jgi:regulator of protease activity HflC (stomatin/prohibitin superfamily)
MIWSAIATAMWVGLGLLTAVKFARCIRIVPQRREFIVERLGKYHATWGAGLHVLIPFFDKVAYVRDLKEESIEVPPQECFTKDNVRVEVDGVIYISVTDSYNASYGVTDYRYAANVLAQTLTRSVIGTLELDRTFEDRESINTRVLGALDEVGEAWGIKVHRYEVKNIVPPATVRDAMERQMAAERERRALLARAEGEKEARINKSLGTKAELVNRSQGEMQRRINEAEGKAEEILALSKATAQSVEKMGWALAQPGGSEAIKLQLSKRYLDKLEHLGRPGTKVVLPADLARMDELLGSIGLSELDVPDEEIVANAKLPPPRIDPLPIPTADDADLAVVPPAEEPVPTLVDAVAQTPAGILEPPRDD